MSLFLLGRRVVADAWCGFRLAGVAIRLGRWRRAIPNVRAALDRPGAGSPSRLGYYRRVQRLRSTPPAPRLSRRLFRAVAHPDRIVWIPREDFTRVMKYDSNLYAGEVLPGEWDRRTMELDGLSRYRSILQHYRDDVPWEETVFFRESAPRLARGEGVREAGGARSGAELRRYYETHVHDVYEDMTAHGFRIRNVPHVHLGRDGRILLGNEGVQRLAMARLAGVRQIPSRVRVRHLEWQRTRERLARFGAGSLGDEGLARHPDLADLVGSSPEPGPVDLYGMADRIPSMGGARIGPLLRNLVRNAPAGTAIVEVGSWLGAGTAQLLLGAGERRRTREVAVHTYDLWRAYRDSRAKAAMFGVRLSWQEDTLPRVRRSLEPFGVPVEFHRGDIRKAGWNDGPISVYVDDAAKTPALFAHVLRTFGPSWMPGETVVVLMDYDHWKRTGIAGHRCQKHFIESNRNCFEPIACRSAGVFLYKRAIDFCRLPAAFESTGRWE